MKAKFFLTLLTLTGLFLSSNSAFASTRSPLVNSSNIDALSQTIANLIDLDRDAHSLVSLAIDRALLAQNSLYNSAGEPSTRQPAPDSNVDRQPIVNGKIANPRNRPRPDRPLINGIIKAPPQTQPDRENPPAIINGLIINPNPDRH
jgi:hypothetical protein